MKYLENYLQTIVDRGNPQLAKSVRITAGTVAEKYLKNFSFTSHEIGLLFGNVQSGKTGQMFGIISTAADIGFPIFILLTTDNVVLQQQTIERVREDIDGFCICDEYDSEVFAENNLEKPTIIVLKKNARTLKQWANILASTGFMKGNPLFVLDDEADAASLNTLINKDKKSSINKYLEQIRDMSACSIYLQVTGTPQSIFLQTMESGWHPYFTYYFAPGEKYLGGDFFFPQEKPSCISYIDELENPLLDATVHHLLASAQILNSGGKVCNFLIHPSVRKASHNKFENEVSNILVEIREKQSESRIVERFKKIYSNLNPEKNELFTFDFLFDKSKELLNQNQIKLLVMNGDSKIASTEYSKGCNIVIGGNTLGRGVTFSGLHTIYYTRTAKKPQADTMWQHSRMFGYDRDPGMMQVYIEERLYKLFADINSTNNSIIAQIERGNENVKIYYPEGLNPTRKNVIDNEKLSIISGNTNYYPYSLKNNSYEDISELLKAFDEKITNYQVSARLVVEILRHITPSDDFKISAFVDVLNMMIAEKPTLQAVLIVRRNRNIAQGTGALLAPNDWQLGASITDKVVLTMYEVTGEKGWGGRPTWVPNIKLPGDIAYYGIEE